MEMSLSVYLSFIVFHLAEGCFLVHRGHGLKIIANVSDTVMLPCYCSDTTVNTAIQSLRWRKYKNLWDTINDTRAQLVNPDSPWNLSLLMSNLTAEDAGIYRCEISAQNYTDIHLIIKESTEMIQEDDLTQTAHTGSSILLPCYSANLITKPYTKPAQFMWRKYSPSKTTWDDVSSDRHRFQLVNDYSSGNLSLLISDLTKEDAGVYRCDLGRDKYTDIKLVVEVHPQPLPFIPFALVTVVFLHIIVAVVYYTIRKKDSVRVYYSTADGDGRVALEY